MSMVQAAVVSTRVTGFPAFSSPAERAMLRQAACAAAISSSGLVPCFPSNRVAKVYGVQLKAGGCELMPEQDGFGKGRDRQEGDRMAVWVSAGQDIGGLAAGITARGGPLDHPPEDMPWGDRGFAITDPDGFKITVI